MDARTRTEKLAGFYLELMDLEKDNPSLEFTVSFDSEQIQKWSQGQAALAIAPPEIDTDSVFTRFYSVAKACQRWQAGPQPVTDEFLKNLTELTKSQRQEIILSLFLVERKNYKIIEEIKAPSGLLEFIAYNTFKSILKTYRETVLSQVKISDWMKGYCPVCGDQPTLAKLTGKDGHRELYCERCETSWCFKRLGCPYCDEASASEASFITFDENKQYRVYLCDKCNSYLKTVDERECGEVDLFCEDLATTELDEIAQAEGYQRGNHKDYCFSRFTC